MRSMQMTVLLVSVLSLAACGSDKGADAGSTPVTVALKPLNLKVRVLNDAAPEYAWSNGVTARSEEEYQQSVQLLLEDGYTIGTVQIMVEEADGRIDISESLIKSSDSGSFNTIEQPLAIPVPGTVYTVVFTAHSHFLGACINRTVPHLGFLISKQGQRKPILDEHAAVWTNNGRPCFGLYQSDPFYWCWAACGPSYRDVVNSLAAILVTAGVAAGTASTIANVMAPIAVAGVAF